MIVETEELIPHHLVVMTIATVLLAVTTTIPVKPATPVTDTGLHHVHENWLTRDIRLHAVDIRATTTTDPLAVDTMICAPQAAMAAMVMTVLRLHQDEARGHQGVDTMITTAVGTTELRRKIGKNWRTSDIRHDSYGSKWLSFCLPYYKFIQNLMNMEALFSNLGSPPFFFFFSYLKMTGKA